MKNRSILERIESIRNSYFWTMQLRKEILLRNIGPVQFRKKWSPNNLPQPAWCLTELFFPSDLSWLQADLCANFYVISTCLSILSTMPLCTRYISNIGIKTGLNFFQDFPYVTIFSLRSISVFYIWNTEQFQKELSPSESVIFGPRDFGKRSFSEILDRCNFRKNGVWQKKLDSLLLSKNTWTSAISERMESYKKKLKAYYLIYLVQTNTFLANPDQKDFWKNWFRIQFLHLKLLTRLSNSLYTILLQSNIYFH